MERFDDPIVREVRDNRAALWEEARQDMAQFLRKAAEFAEKLGLKPCGCEPVTPNLSF